jgi:hypothetical protein
MQQWRKEQFLPVPGIEPKLPSHPASSLDIIWAELSSFIMERNGHSEELTKLFTR